MDINLQGWDTLNLVHFDVVNALIKKANSTPGKFSYPSATTFDTNITPPLRLQDVVFDAWQVITGSGSNLRVKCPFLSGTITDGTSTVDLTGKSGDDNQPFVVFECNLKFAFNESDPNKPSLLKPDTGKAVTVFGTSPMVVTPPPPPNVVVLQASDTDAAPNTQGFLISRGARSDWSDVPSNLSGNALVASGGNADTNLATTAMWRFTNLKPGATYRISATWPKGVGTETDVQYTVRGPGSLGGRQLDQTLDLSVPANADFQTTSNGRTIGWKNIGNPNFVLGDATQLTVEMFTIDQGNSDDKIVADAIRIEEIVATPAPTPAPTFTIESSKLLLEDYFNDHLADFDHTFHAIILNDRADIDDFQWIKPTAVTYAVEPSTSTIGVLCNTEGRTSGLAQQFPSNLFSSMTDKAKNAGANSAFVISAERFAAKILLNAATALFPNQQFQITGDQRIVSNVSSIPWNNLDVGNGTTVNATIPPGGLKLVVVGNTIELQFSGVTFPMPETFGGNAIFTMRFTQVFWLKLVDVKDSTGKVIGQSLLPIDYDPAGPVPTTSAPFFKDVRFSHSLDITATTIAVIVNVASIALGVLGIASFRWGQKAAEGVATVSDGKQMQTVVQQGGVPDPAQPNHTNYDIVPNNASSSNNVVSNNNQIYNSAHLIPLSNPIADTGNYGVFTVLRDGRPVYVPPGRQPVQVSTANGNQYIQAWEPFEEPRHAPNPVEVDSAGLLDDFVNATTATKIAMVGGVVFSLGAIALLGSYWGFYNKNDPHLQDGLTSLLTQGFQKSDWTGVSDWTLLDFQFGGGLVFYGKWDLSPPPAPPANPKRLA